MKFVEHVLEIVNFDICFDKSDLLTLEPCNIVDIYFVSIEAWAQVAILLACGPDVVAVNCLGQVVFWVDLPVQRRLCLIFVSGVGLPDIHEYSAG